MGQKTPSERMQVLTSDRMEFNRTSITEKHLEKSPNSWKIRRHTSKEPTVSEAVRREARRYSERKEITTCLCAGYGEGSVCVGPCGAERWCQEGSRVSPRQTRGNGKNRAAREKAKMKKRKKEENQVWGLGTTGKLTELQIRQEQGRDDQFRERKKRHVPEALRPSEGTGTWQARLCPQTPRGK